MRSMTEPTTADARRAGRRAALRRPRQRAGRRRPGTRADRLADGRRRVRHPCRRTSPTARRHVRPARGGAQRAHRPRLDVTPEVHADDVHRRHRGDRRRPGRPVRQQRRRRQRARPGRRPPGARAHARRPRAAGRRACCPTARRRSPPSPHGHDTYQRAGSGPAMAQFIAPGRPQRPGPGRLRRPARPRPGDVRHADRGRRLA